MAVFAEIQQKRYYQTLSELAELFKHYQLTRFSRINNGAYLDVQAFDALHEVVVKIKDTFYVSEEILDGFIPGSQIPNGRVVENYTGTISARLSNYMAETNGNKVGITILKFLRAAGVHSAVDIVVIPRGYSLELFTLAAASMGRDTKKPMPGYETLRLVQTIVSFLNRLHRGSVSTNLDVPSPVSREKKDLKVHFWNTFCEVALAFNLGDELIAAFEEADTRNLPWLGINPDIACVYPERTEYVRNQITALRESPMVDPHHTV